MCQVIELKNLLKRSGEIQAVDNVSFTVNKGKFFGLLRENGAGKDYYAQDTGYHAEAHRRDSLLESLDVVKEPEKVRAHTGILFGGETGLYDRLTAAESIIYFGELNEFALPRYRSSEKTPPNRPAHSVSLCIPLYPRANSSAEFVLLPPT